MIIAGIDVGLEDTKVVILDNKKIIGKAIGCSGGENRSEMIEKIWREALQNAGKAGDEISHITATGRGKMDVRLASNTVAESIADAVAAKFVDAKATSVLDAGADQTQIVVFGEENRIDTVILNQKCMGGLGLLLTRAADLLGLGLEDFSAIPADGGLRLNDGCPNFVELDIMEHLNEGTVKEKIASAVTEVISIRLKSILNDVPSATENHAVVWFGGMAKNRSLVNALKNRTRVNFIIPDNPEYGGALGAALIAANEAELAK